MFKGIVSLLSSLGGIINKLLRRAERAEFREAGSNEERLRTLEGNIDAAARKKELEHEASRLTDADRRDKLGRFVRNKQPGDESE